MYRQLFVDTPLTPSQSPENGSQHCKEIAMDLVGEALARELSQSPENGSQHCKSDETFGLNGEPAYASQSPENGSQHCKLSIS